MSEKLFDYPSFLFGIFAGITILFLIAWIYEYGYDFWNQYKELIGGFLIGFALMYAIHKIDWEVGF